MEKKQNNQIGKIIKELFELLVLKIEYAFGKYSNSKDGYLTHNSRLWFLGNSRTDNEDLFRNFLRGRINHIKKKLIIYNNLKNKVLKYILYIFILPVVLTFLFFLIPQPEVKLIFRIIITFLLAISSVIIVILMNAAPTEKKVIATEAFLKLLEKYFNSQHPMDILNKNMVIIETSKVVLPFTPAELAAFFGLMLNNQLIKGIKPIQVTSFLENNCCQIDGTTYKNMSSMFTKYGKGDINPEIALNSFIDKITQNNKKQSILN